MHLYNPICYVAVTAGDQSLETAQRETNEELGIDVPVEVGKQNALHDKACFQHVSGCMSKLCLSWAVWAVRQLTPHMTASQSCNCGAWHCCSNVIHTCLQLIALQAIEPLFSMQAAFHTNGGSFVNNEFIDVYLVTLKEEVPAHMFVLQPEEVAAVRSAHNG